MSDEVSTIEVNFDEDTLKSIIDIFVKQKTTVVEWELYNELVVSGVSSERCLFQVAINSVVHQALIEQLKANKDNDKNNK